jgi:hypothetical protein
MSESEIYALIQERLETQEIKFLRPLPGTTRRNDLHDEEIRDQLRETAVIKDIRLQWRKQL